MNEDNWRTLGYIAVVLAFLILIGGFITYAYPRQIYVLGYPEGTVYPYRGYSVGFFAAGIAFFVIGSASLASGHNSEARAPRRNKETRR
jgi:hypothetical protein